MKNSAKNNARTPSFDKNQLSKAEMRNTKGGFLAFTCEEKRGKDLFGNEYAYEQMNLIVFGFLSIPVSRQRL